MRGFVFVLSTQQIHTFALIFIAKFELIKIEKKVFLVPFVLSIRKSFFFDNIERKIFEKVEREKLKHC